MKIETIYTNRLILRGYEEKDLNDLYECLSDPKVVEYEPYDVMTLEETKKALLDRIDSGEWIAIEEKQSGKMIGNVYLGIRYWESREIGYILNHDFWGKGYATEAALAVCRMAFSDGVHRLEGNCDPKNVASRRVLEKLGFTLEGHLKDNCYFRNDSEGNPIWKDTLIFSMLSTAF